MNEPHPQRRTLLVGGHLDGQWVDVDRNATTYRVVKPTAIDYRRLAPEAAGAGFPLPEQVDYRIECMPFAIRAARADVWIGTLLELRGPERDLAVVRALFQRDVAVLFKETW